ncbi:MAG: HU family DNA-binding protein [Bacteroidales bacterium]|nr:HU family DNA-binding protein [Bacteroidales bacterium]
MAHFYKVGKKKFRKNGIWQELNYPVGVYKGVLNRDDIANILAERTTIKQADLAGALVGLSQIIEEKLHQGYKVNLEGIGIFSLSLTSDIGYFSPEEVLPRRVKANKVCYKASQKLQKNLEFVQFERPRNK